MYWNKIRYVKRQITMINDIINKLKIKNAEIIPIGKQNSIVNAYIVNSYTLITFMAKL